MTIEHTAEQTAPVTSPHALPILHQQVTHTPTGVHVEAAGRYAELMRVAFLTHQTGQHRVVLFTAPASGAGVSFVSSAAANELSTLVSGSILVVEAALLDRLSLRSHRVDSWIAVSSGARSA